MRIRPISCAGSAQWTPATPSPIRATRGSSACRWFRSPWSVTRKIRSARRRSDKERGSALTIGREETAMRSLLTALVIAVWALMLTPAAAQTGDKDTMVVAFGAESTTLDPIKAAAGVDYYFISQIFENLLRQGDDAKT